MAAIETTYSTQELTGLLGISQQAITKRAKREGWQALPRAGRGGGKLWVVSSMPAEIRDRLASALLRQPAAITEKSADCASIGSNICTPIGTAGNGPAVLLYLLKSIHNWTNRFNANFLLHRGRFHFLRKESQSLPLHRLTPWNSRHCFLN